MYIDLSPMNIFNYHSTSPFPVDLNEDQNHHQHLISPKPEFSSSSSSFSCPTFFYPTQDQGGVLYYREVQQYLSPQQEEQEADRKYDFGGGLCDHPTLENETDSGLKFTIWKKEDKIENHETENSTTSEKWKKPSKLRIVRKMVNSDQTGKGTLPSSNPMQNFENHKQPSSPSETDNSSSSNTIIRVCADCNTTKTPLWRGGPRGPKTLCNACGIRQRKARKAAAAAAAAENGGSVVLAAESNPSMKKKVQKKVKRSSKGCVAKYKKRCKLTATPASGSSRKNICFEEFTISLRKKYAAFQQVFPQDEKEAAILLMALSYGLVRGN